MKIWQELFSWERAMNFDISVCWRNQKIKNLFFIQYKESMDRIDFHNRSNLINSNTRWVMREAIWQNYVGNVFLPNFNNTNWGMGIFFFFVIDWLVLVLFVYNFEYAEVILSFEIVAFFDMMQEKQRHVYRRKRCQKKNNVYFYSSLLFTIITVAFFFVQQ